MVHVLDVSVVGIFFNCILRKCQSFIYSGQEGNSNNFESFEKCVQICSELKNN